MGYSPLRFRYCFCSTKKERKMKIDLNDPVFIFYIIGSLSFLAGSITGLSYDDVVDYFLFTKQELESYGYEVFHPMTGKGYLRNEVEFKAVGYDSHSPVST